MQISDETLLASAQEGDRDALEELLGRHQRKVFRFGIKMCGAEEDAKDVLQETLLAAARNIRDFRGASSISTWLYTIARSFCIKHHRTSKFAPSQLESLESSAREAQQIPDTGRGPEEAAAGEQVRIAIQAVVAALDPMYREVLVLRDVEGLSAAEVAEILGLSVEAVKSRLHRARVSVRQRIAPLLGVPDPEANALVPSTAKTCTEVATLFSRYVDGELSGAICTLLEEHIRRCPLCRTRCDSLRTTLSSCSRAGDELPPEVAREVRQALQQFLKTLELQK